jgi:Neuraminidase (sialidase)
MLSSPKLRWTKTICRQPGNYLGWPSIARKADGEIMVVFSGDREEHACPYGKIQIVRSLDGGESWSEPITIGNTVLDDRDPGIIVLRSGTIVVSWFNLDFAHFSPEDLDQSRWSKSAQMVDGWIRHYRKIPREHVERDSGAWTIRSTDGGNTWEEPVANLTDTPHGPIELADGRLLFVGTTHSDDLRRIESVAIAVESADEGRTWRQVGEVPMPPKAPNIHLQFDEPSLAETPDGKLVCLARYEDNDRIDGYLRQSESTDGGKTWTVPQKTSIWGFPPHLVVLSIGDLLATYGYRRRPFGRRACLSRDGGLTWDIEHEIVLKDDAPNSDLGYPATLELEPNEYLTVDYQAEPREKTVIVATCWSLE